MENVRPSAYSLLWQARDVLLASPAWIEYARNVYSVDPGGYPFLSYVGVNFTHESIKNYKFYFSFFKPLSREEVATLLPVADQGRFWEMYKLWQPTRDYEFIHRGLTFAVKVEADGTLTHYYHLRMRGLPFGPPERIELKELDRDNYHGVCEEFTGSKIHLKRYYYLYDRDSVAETLAIAGLPDRTEAIECVEYIESEGRDKMAWITGDRRLLDALIHERGQPRLSQGLAKMCNDCRFDQFGPGSSRDAGDHSIYFVENTGVRGNYGYLFDGVRTFAKRHLRLHRFPEV